MNDENELFLKQMKGSPKLKRTTGCEIPTQKKTKWTKNIQSQT